MNIYLKFNKNIRTCGHPNDGIKYKSRELNLKPSPIPREAIMRRVLNMA